MDSSILDKDVAFIQKEPKVTMLGDIVSNITAVTFYLLGNATLV